MRKLFVLFFLFCFCAAQAQKFVAPQSLFGFDPLNNRYVPHHLAPVATYLAEWRKERPELTLAVSDSLLDPATKYYLNHVDTTLYHRILTYLNATKTSKPTPTQDSSLYSFPSSRPFLDFFDGDMQAMRRFFATPIARFDTVVAFDPYAPSPLSQLFHVFQLETSRADLSLWAPPRLDASLGPELYIKDIYWLLRYPNTLVVVELSGKEIKALLEETNSRRYHTLRSPQSDLLNTNLPPSMHQSLAGLPYRVDLTKPKGRRIDAPGLEPNRIYTVTLNSYAAQKLGKKTIELGDYNTLLINYIKRKNVPENPEKWRLGPERWSEEIKARERLFFRTK